MSDSAAVETIFTDYPGGNCVIAGMHGYVTAFHSEGPHKVGAFVKVPISDDAGPTMLFVRLGRRADEKHHEVASVRAISRDEFDRITDLDTLRRELGWR